MKRELEFADIYYNECDLVYIDELCDSLNLYYEKYKEFFQCDGLNQRIEIHLFDDIQKFREELMKDGYYKSIDDIPKWVCGSTPHGKNEIRMLSYPEITKAQSHENADYEYIIKTLRHELVHSFQHMFEDDTLQWFADGMACLISDQYLGKEVKIECDLETLISGKTSYQYFYSMFYYLYNNYDKEYILKLLKDCQLLIEETPRIYDEAKEWVNNLRKLG